MKTIWNWILDLIGLGPKAPVKWQKRLDRQMCFFSAPNYYWMKMSNSDINEALDLIVESGLDGPSLEFAGRATADEYNGNPDHTPVTTTYRQNIEAWKPWHEAIKRRGLVAHIAFCNTNTVRNNTINDTEWANLANEFLHTYGTENKIILPTSETDQRTRASIRSILDHVFRSRMPGRQMIRGGTPPAGEGYGEHHSQKGNDIPRGNHRQLVVSDSGPAIGYLYGGSWRDGGVPDIDHISQYVKTIKASGCSGAVYSFSRKFDAAGCRVAGKAWK